ncbi:MAG: hypothetical protein QJR02_06335 [Sinobacteraceae bacterium]|nr:hypothetical protein [Nevskia sp.]MDI3259296.1 hypothetical protein [Nevskiaceae bacterium]
MKSMFKAACLVVAACAMPLAYADGTAANSDTYAQSVASGTVATIVAISVGGAAAIGALIAGSTAPGGTSTTTTTTTH